MVNLVFLLSDDCSVTHARHELETEPHSRLFSPLRQAKYERDLRCYASVVLPLLTFLFSLSTHLEGSLPT